MAIEVDYPARPQFARAGAMPKLDRGVLYAMRDQIAARIGWYCFTWLLSAVYLAYSVCYMTGFSVTTGPSYAAFLQLPGGLHTHGVIQFVVFVAMSYGLLPSLFKDRHGRRLPANVDLVRKMLARVTAVHAGLTSLAFMFAPVAPGGAANVGWIPWTAFCFWALILAFIPPYVIPAAHRPDGRDADAEPSADAGRPRGEA